MAQDPYRYFRPEARNLLDQFAQGVLELEKDGGSAGAVQRLLRLAHTLKGAARVVRQSAIAERAHAIENTLAPFRDCTSAIARDNIDVILAHLDYIGGQIVSLVPADGSDGQAQGQSPAKGNSKNAAAVQILPSDATRAIRADSVDMDAVLDGVTETHARLNGLRRSAGAIEQIGHLVDLLQMQFALPGEHERSRSAGVPPAAIAAQLRDKVTSLANDFTTSLARVDRELHQLRDASEALRLVAIDTVLTALKRTARDCAHAVSKQIAFEASGGDIKLDADVLGIIQSALIQIIRNAVAHGIETESERVAAGKPAAGRITVGVSRRGQEILLTCSDDGRGIDLQAVREIAVQRGLLSPSAADYPADDLVRLLLRGGISTSATVTDVAGRGVGLDVVREALERLGGEVAVRVEPGRGTSFELVIPRSVTAVKALHVEAVPHGDVLALPLDGVRAIVRLAAGDIACASAGASIIHDGKAVPFIPLAAALDGAPWSADRKWTALVVSGRDGIAAVGVERLVGTAHTVVRPLPEHLGANAVVVGAALDGEGNPQLILDPDGLVTAAQAMQQFGAREVAADATLARRPVLVVDDSLTTRMLEKSILESAGYDVEVASSGEEGLDLARRKPFALILCDVEMPGIDGFTFVERVRADAALRDIPAILVTSCSAPEHRQRGRDVGARGYIVKSEFNQAELLTMIRPMVG
jgi:two-component system chemotaxis sensor kinase CheA